MDLCKIIIASPGVVVEVLNIILVESYDVFIYPLHSISIFEKDEEINYWRTCVSCRYFL
ncbi:MAG: hypothetical protein QXW87_00745 [Desulfurococcaceae archaeon]